MRVRRGRKFVRRPNFQAATKGQRECNSNNVKVQARPWRFVYYLQLEKVEYLFRFIHHIIALYFCNFSQWIMNELSSDEEVTRSRVSHTWLGSKGD